MHLKSINIQGFKSFAKKVNIDLSTPVTGVVGPNGSGKSNVAEAIRFVLGEQSMKGLRSKSGSDLIFKGSPHISPLSRANVSIHLDNSNKKINEKFINNNHEISTTLSGFINLDEIILTREIYTDGASEYLINGTKVRLKDVQELLAMSNISASGHTIVNQGEADKILLSNNNDKREMIEDALGLRIYHLRIKESEKKLEKVKTHLTEIELIRKENIPHLNYLRKQVKELEKREQEISSLNKMLQIYLYKENKEIEKNKKELPDNNIEDNIEKYEKELENLLLKQKDNENKITKKEEESLKNNINNKINSTLEKINILSTERNTIYNEILNTEVELKFLIKKEEDIQIYKKNESEKSFLINKQKFLNFENIQEIAWEEVFKLLDSKEYSNIPKYIQNVYNKEKEFLKYIKDLNTDSRELEKLSINDNKDYSSRIEELGKIKKEKTFSLEKLDKEIEILNIEKNNKETELNEIKLKMKEEDFLLDKNILEIKLTLQKLYSEKNTIKIKEDSLKKQEENFEHITKDMIVILGTNTFKYRSFEEENMSELDKNFFNANQNDLLRKIERSKIKIEEGGVANPVDLVEEFKTLSERDEFLNKEIMDLEDSRKNLENLISDLKNTLLLDFNKGLEKINLNFNKYFSEIFTGGKASLVIEKKKEKETEEFENEEEEKKEPGIEINVNLPQKKVKDLQMLSGGERALTSIALIFAMSSINHPPFMVLDETDAALDEANARKYGKMIRRLAENSKLLVITHNRETMNQCDVLYGVTLGGEGSSKLLSIKFDDATEYAK